MSAKITVDEAREYFAHPSQQYMGITPENLPGEPVQYWADGLVCGLFHEVAWPGVWQAHVAAKPEAWGETVPCATEIIAAFRAAERPTRLIAWIDAGNRQTLSFARRLGFTKDGAMPIPTGEVIMMGME